MNSSEKPNARRYETSLKLHVVAEVQSGRMNISQASRKYGIDGHMTITRWIRKFGILQENKKAGEIMDSNKEKKLRELEVKNRELKKELSAREREVFVYQTIMEMSYAYKDPLLKKKIEQELPKKLSEKGAGLTEEELKSQISVKLWDIVEAHTIKEKKQPKKGKSRSKK